MKTIYVLATPAYHEQEEVVFTYAVYDEQDELIRKFVVNYEYKKPVLVGLFSIMVLLKEIKEYKGEAIHIVVNDGALVEQIKLTTTTQNREVLKATDLTRRHIIRFSKRLTFESVAGDYQRMLLWESKLL